ncbi:MAG: twin-arginine translocation signal domain-containing protein, partial [Planctomycetes bacterium]|nr:twin-arginine translocation signal domain-containing protein [Planctomycetota bacterium]
MRKEDASRELPCPDCDDVSRRRFLRTAATAATAVGTAGLSLGAAGNLLSAEEKKKVQPAETAVKQLFDSLEDNQRKLVCMPFGHELRSKINNNWHFVDPKVAAIGKLYNADQQEMILQIFKGVTSEDGYKRFQKQMKDDAGGFDKYT